MQSYNGTATPIERARDLVPMIEAHADSIDHDRELPVELSDAMKSAGMFRLLVPRSLGGEEMSWPEFLDVVRTIAHVDGSTAWCFNQGAVWATTSCRAPRALAEEVWGDPRTVVGNGPPQGASCEEVDGGFLISGRWNFSSGCRHANWLAALTAGPNQPARLHMVPRDELELLDVWQVHGLRGTGSYSFHADRHFVPTSRSFPTNSPTNESGPLYVIPQSLMFACGFGCVALGVARSGLDSVYELARNKKPQFGRQTLAQDPVVQSKVGRAEALWQAAKALLYESVHAVWENVCDTGSITLDERLQLRMVGTHAIRQSADVIDIVYNLSGSTSIFESTKIQRKFQDIHVITQQVQGRESHYQTVGSHFLGEEPKGGIF